MALSLPVTKVFASKYICGPCRKIFMAEGKSILEGLDFEDLVRIKTTSCLGDFYKPVLLKFQNKVYKYGKRN